MDSVGMNTTMLMSAVEGASALKMIWFYVQIFIGFSFIIFIHELGHFMVAKWAGVRVEQFAIGFFREVFGFTRGETRYSFNLLPLGGYVKMLGQEDFEVDTTGELQFKDDPRSFANKTVGKRMAIVSAGVIMNLILAGFLFMVVFLVGKEVVAPKVGIVLSDSPAGLAGLESGDIIREINGTEIDEFNDINMAVLLAKPGEPLEFQVERAGQTKSVQISPERDPNQDLLQIGIRSASSAIIAGIGPDYSEDVASDPHPGDKIVRLGGADGLEVNDENANEMVSLLFTDPLAYPKAIVERPVDLEASADADDLKTETVEINLQPRLLLRRADFENNPPHILGLAPLRRVSMVKPKGRADLAGIRVGDVIVRWDKIDYPTGMQIRDNIVASTEETPDRPERDIPIRVLRGDTGKIERLVIRPHVKVVPITGKHKPPSIDASLDLLADDLLRVAEVVPTAVGMPTPAAEAGIPAGALIRTVNDKPVTRWVELVQAFRNNAGGDVTVGYDTDDKEGLSATMHVPQSLRTALGVGPESMIVAVNGDEMVDIETNGKRIPAVVNDPAGLQTALRQFVGKTVPIRYRAHPLAEAETADVTVTREMIYPWLGTVGYTVDLATGAEVTLLRKTNPVDALMVGVRKTYYFVVQVYQVMERMIFSRSLGVENISGPVGIVKLGSRMAEKSWVDLLYFLAIISANLAVINFLPLPIVDGGLMVFLIIEKIKGSPISMRVQVATQVVGLVLIVSAFVFVTIQDLFR